MLTFVADEGWEGRVRLCLTRSLPRTSLSSGSDRCRRSNVVILRQVRRQRWRRRRVDRASARNGVRRCRANAHQDAEESSKQRRRRGTEVRLFPRINHLERFYSMCGQFMTQVAKVKQEMIQKCIHEAGCARRKSIIENGSSNLLCKCDQQGPMSSTNLVARKADCTQEHHLFISTKHH